MSSSGSSNPSRRAMLCGLAALPAVPGTSQSGERSGGKCGAAGVMERWTPQAGDPRLRARHDRSGEQGFRSARGAHRHFRPGRHALGRASDLHASDFLPRPRAGRGQGEARTGPRRAIQDCADGRFREDREASAARLREDRNGDPHGHGRGHVSGRREGVDHRGQGSALEASLHRTRPTSRCRRS